MSVGDIVTWPWYLGHEWEPAYVSGIIVNSRRAKTDYEKLIIYNVLLTDGTLCEVRDDKAGLKLIA